MTPAIAITRRCKDCRRPLDAAHAWRCHSCIERRIERIGGSR